MEREQESVVIVEDDLAHRSLIKNVLISEGFSVFAAADGEGGFDLIRGVMPFVVITDLMLPGFDGLELCRRMRAHPKMGSIAIIFTSARSGEQEMKEAASLGAEDYLTKPYKLTDLLDRVRAILRRSRKRRESEGLNLERRTDPKSLEGSAERSDLLLGGRLSMLGLVEVLQAIDLASLTARLEVSSGDADAVLEFRNGKLLYASVSAKKNQLFGMKAWLRCTTWKDGVFQMLQVHPNASEPDKNMPDTPLPALLVDAGLHREDWLGLRKQFSDSSFLFRQKSLPVNATPIEGQVWHSLGQGIYLTALLDELPLKDAELLRGVLGLKEKGVLVSS